MATAAPKPCSQPGCGVLVRDGTSRCSKHSREAYIQVELLPNWLPEPLMPVVVICGPPGSGKSTYALKIAAPLDLIIDVDDLASKISGKPIYHATVRERMLAIRDRNTLLAGLDRAPEITKVWLIVTAGKPVEREFWRRRYIDLVVMPTSPSECIARINKDDRRPQAEKQAAIAAVNRWQ